MSDPQVPIPSQKPEPAFNAPWPAVALLAALAVAFAAQTLTYGDGVPLPLTFSPAGLTDGRYATLVTAMFVHGGWVHLALNALGALAFGTPVARYLGLGARGALLFFIYFIACGVLANLAYAAVNRYDTVPLLGASGGIAGLMAGASRLIDRRGRLGPLLGRTPVGMAAAWVVINLIFAAIGTAPGANGAQIAWEAHLAGYFVGLMLITPFGWLAGVEGRAER